MSSKAPSTGTTSERVLSYSADDTKALDKDLASDPEELLSFIESLDAQTVAFFPGCSLRRLAPELSTHVFEWLKDEGYAAHQYLGCCGLPSFFADEIERFEKTTLSLFSYLRKKTVTTIIASCPNCYYALRDAALTQAADFRIIPLPALLVGKGMKISKDGFDDATLFTIQDSCPDTQELLFAHALRELASELNLVEMEHSLHDSLCCGAGQRFADLCFEEQVEQAEKRLSEADEINADIVITACASCTYALTAAEGDQEVYHYLELLFNVWFG